MNAQNERDRIFRIPASEPGSQQPSIKNIWFGLRKPQNTAEELNLRKPEKSSFYKLKRSDEQMSLKEEQKHPLVIRLEPKNLPEK